MVSRAAIAYPAKAVTLAWSWHLGQLIQLDYVHMFKEQGAVHLIAAWVKNGMTESPQ